MTDFSLADVFALVASTTPDRPAVVWRDDTLRYGAMLDRVYRFANAIGAHDPAPSTRAQRARWESDQDHVAILMRNRPEWLEAMYGAYAARAVPCNVNYRYVAAELAHVLRVVRPRIVVYETEF